jgi:hypothetical protein
VSSGGAELAGYLGLEVGRSDEKGRGEEEEETH